MDEPSKGSMRDAQLQYSRRENHDACTLLLIGSKL
jgi:hypothetical protein